MAVHGVEIVAQQLFARGRRQALPDGCGRFGESAAEAEVGLEPAAGVHHQAGQIALAVACGRRQRPVGQAQATVTRAQDAAGQGQ